MTSQSEPIFPIIPQPMALAVDTLSKPFRRSPTPSGVVSCDAKTSSRSPSSASSAFSPPSSSLSASSSASKPDPRLSLFHEDVFSRLLSGPLVIFHLAFYCAVPVTYLLRFSPFSRDSAHGVDVYGAGEEEMSHLVRWMLLFLTQYMTAILTVSFFGRCMVRKEVTAGVFMLTAAGLLARLKMFLEDMAVSKG